MGKLPPESGEKHHCLRSLIFRVGMAEQQHLTFSNVFSCARDAGLWASQPAVDSGK